MDVDVGAQRDLARAHALRRFRLLNLVDLVWFNGAQ
jgi:hypothetical protein